MRKNKGRISFMESLCDNNSTYNTLNNFFQLDKLEQEEKFLDLLEKVGTDVFVDYYEKYFIKKYSIDFLISRIKIPKKSPIKTIAIYTVGLSRGGVERISVTLANNLIKLGYNIIIFTERITSNDFTVNEDVTIISLVRESEESLYSVLKRNVSKHIIDVVICPYFNNPYSALLFALENIPIIGTHHGELAYYEEYLKKDLFALTRSMMPLFLVKILLSRYEKIAFNTILKEGNSQFIFLPNFPTFAPKKISPPEENQKNILYIGRISSEKNIPFLIDSFALVLKKHPDAKLFLVGATEDVLLWNYVEKKIKRHNIQRSISFVEYEKDVTKYLKKATIHILTSLSEGFPTVLLEAKAYGIPSVVAELPFQELFYLPGTLIVEQDNVRKMSEAICLLLENKEMRERLGREAQESLNWINSQKIIEKWQEILSYLGNADGTIPFPEDYTFPDLVYTEKEILEIYAKRKTVLSKGHRKMLKFSKRNAVIRLFIRFRKSISKRIEKLKRKLQ